MSEVESNQSNSEFGSGSFSRKERYFSQQLRLVGVEIEKFSQDRNYIQEIWEQTMFATHMTKSCEPFSQYWNFRM